MDRIRLGKRLTRSAFSTDATTLARDLLGCVLVRVLDDGTRLSGIIVETEAYLGVKDRASHAFGGRRTARNEAMYDVPGTTYVYFTYGMHFCFNIVCGEVGDPLAVLVRALEPVEGIERMRELRAGRDKPQGDKAGKNGKTGSVRKERKETELCSGPAKLCQAMAIDRSLNGIDMTRDERLSVCKRLLNKGRAGGDRGTEKPAKVVRAARIGIAYAGEWVEKPLRFVVDGNPHVSVRP